MITAAELNSIAKSSKENINSYVEHILGTAKMVAQKGHFSTAFTYDDMPKEVFMLIDEKLRSLGFKSGYSMLNDKIYQVRVSWY